MRADHCYGCGVSMHLEFAQGVSDVYCKYCADELGALLPREVVQDRIADWLITWQPDLDKPRALARADLYMRAMPAWAEN